MLGKRFLKTLAVGLAMGGAASAAHAGDVEWNGFGSLYYAQALEKELLPPNFTDSKADFSTFSLFGLNVGGKLNDQMSIATQLISASQAATGTWSMYANWAYLQYKPVDSVAIKLGRQLFPVFIGSEYDKVGQILPYRKVPGITVLSPFSGFDGVSAAYTMGLTDTMKFTVSAFGGRPNYELSASTRAAGYVGTADELMGATATVDGDGWRVRAMYSRNRAYIAVPSTAAGLPAGIAGSTVQSLVDQLSVGYRLDKWNFVSYGELMNRTGKDSTMIGTTPFLNSLKGGYVLLGYRIGDFMPRYTFLHSDALIGLGTGGFDSHTIGVNYAITPMATFKVDYEMVTALDNGVYGLTRATGSTKKDGNAVYAGVDFIF